MRFVQKNIEAEWSKIKQAVAETLHPSDSLEEIYHKCRSKEAYLFVVPEGFLIVSEYKEATGEKNLFIWMAYGKGEDLFKKYGPDIEELANRIGASTISFRTNRRGFERVLSEDWAVEHIEYRKRIA